MPRCCSRSGLTLLCTLKSYGNQHSYNPCGLRSSKSKGSCMKKEERRGEERAEVTTGKAGPHITEVRFLETQWQCHLVGEVDFLLPIDLLLDLPLLRQLLQRLHHGLVRERAGWGRDPGAAGPRAGPDPGPPAAETAAPLPRRHHAPPSSPPRRPPSPSCPGRARAAGCRRRPARCAADSVPGGSAAGSRRRRLRGGNSGHAGDQGRGREGEEGPGPLTRRRAAVSPFAHPRATPVERTAEAEGILRGAAPPPRPSTCARAAPSLPVRAAPPIGRRRGAGRLGGGSP